MDLSFCTGCVAGKNAGWCVGTCIFPPSGIIVWRDFSGEIPTGFITDKIGYRKSLILAQVLLLGARSLLLAAFVSRSLVLFVVEAVVEGIAACFTSGTGSAYLYALYGENGYLAKTAHAGISEQQVLSSVRLRMPGFIK